MLLVLVVVSALLHFHVPGFADGTSDHVDVHPADMYLRGVEESRNLEGLERHKRQSNDLEFREMFVTQCGYSVLEPEGEPSINIKGIGLNNWNAIEKTAKLIHLMVRFMPRPIFVQLASKSSVGLFSVVNLPTLVFDEFKDIGNCLASCAGECLKWCTSQDYTYYPNYPISYLWAYGNMSRAFVVESNMMCEGYNPSNVWMDKWKTEGHDQASPCYRLLYKEYKDTPEQPELQHLGNENLLVREYGLTVMTRGISNETREMISAAFNTAKEKGKWSQIRNEYEYFMKATVVWFDASRQLTQGGMACKATFSCGEINPVHRLYLKQEDPELYSLLNYVYNNNREYLNSDTSTCNW